MVCRISARRGKVRWACVLSYAFTVVALFRGESTMYAPVVSAPSTRSSAATTSPYQCAREVHGTWLPRLIEKMNGDRDANALIPHRLLASGNGTSSTEGTAQANGPHRDMPGLHLGTFEGRRIAFLGDSTLFYMAKYIVSMLQHNVRSAVEDRPRYDVMTRRHADTYVVNNKQIVLQGTAAPPPYRVGDTWFQWWGMAGEFFSPCAELFVTGTQLSD